MANKAVGDFDNVNDTELDGDDHAEVSDELRPLAAQYKTFGTALGIRAPDMKRIGMDHINFPDSEAKLNEVILLCLQKEYKVEKYGLPTWKKFVTTTAKYNNALAKQIAARHLAAPLQVQAPPPAPNPVTSPTTVTIATPTVAPNLLEIITHAKTTVEHLNRECSKDTTVLRQLADCCYPFQIIGPHLNLEEQEMEDIEDDNRRAEQKRLAMLKKWHNKFTHKATYLALVQALANSGRNSQAADVCKIVAAQEVPLPPSQSTQPPATAWPGRESQQSNHPPAQTTRAVPEVQATPVPKPPTQHHLADQGHVQSGQYGEYLSKSTENIKTVYEHWNLGDIHNLEITGKGITIAIIDDGLDCSHLSIKQKYDRGEIRGFPTGTWNHDKAEHGTAIAAIAAGYGYRNESEQVMPRGIAPEANLYVYRLGENFNRGDNEMAAANELSAALDHILNLQEPRIDVVAMSLCLPKINMMVKRKLEELAKKRIVCVAAAGNSGVLKPGARFPASDGNVISVGAIEDTGQVANFNPDSEINVYAFGKNVVVPLLTSANAASHLDGTSFAVPMVAGFLALLFQCTKQFPNCEDAYDLYHDVSFLNEHFKACHKLCKDQRLFYVNTYFKDLWKDRMQDPSPLVAYYTDIVQ